MTVATFPHATETRTKPAKANAPNATDARFESIAIPQIRESKTNPRRTFVGLDELADSVRSKGIIQPLIVRPAPGRTAYELVVGARRFRAAQLATMTHVPCIVRDYSDVEAVELQVIENDQREDPHPLEEAAGFAQLIELGRDPKSIAEKLGRPVEYVAKRLQLVKLNKAARKLFEEDKIGVGHAFEICRLAPSAQERAVKFIEAGLRGYHKSAPDLAELRRHISADSMRDLSAARWKKDDATLVGGCGDCNSCMKNTANQRALFDDVNPKKPHCTDPECYDKKETAFVQLSVKRLVDAGEKPLLVADQVYGRDGAALEKRFGEKVHSKWALQELTPKQARGMNGKVRKAVIVDGDEPGRVILVSTEDIRRDSTAADKRYKAEQLRKQKAAQQQTSINERILDAILDAAEKGKTTSDALLRVLVPEWFSRVWNEGQKVIARRHGWKPAKKNDYGWAERSARAFAAEASRPQLVRLAVETALIGAVKVSPHYYGNSDKKVLAAAAKAVSVNTDRVRRQFLAVQAKTEAKAASKPSASRKERAR